jgi:hypothetical protein
MDGQERIREGYESIVPLIYKRKKGALPTIVNGVNKLGADDDGCAQLEIQVDDQDNGLQSGKLLPMDRDVFIAGFKMNVPEARDESEEEERTRFVD